MLATGGLLALVAAASLKAEVPKLVDARLDKQGRGYRFTAAAEVPGALARLDIEVALEGAPPPQHLPPGPPQEQHTAPMLPAPPAPPVHASAPQPPRPSSWMRPPPRPPAFSGRGGFPGASSPAGDGISSAGPPPGPSLPGVGAPFPGPRAMAPPSAVGRPLPPGAGSMPLGPPDRPPPPGAGSQPVGPPGGVSLPGRVKIPMAGVSSAWLATGFDSRMVQQRVLAPHLSTPLEVEVQKGTAFWKIRYNAYREGHDPSMVEDAFSQPVVDALRQADGAAFLRTQMGRAVQDLVTSQQPLASFGDPVLAEVRALRDRRALPLKLARKGQNPMYHLGLEPTAFDLVVQVERTGLEVWPDRVKKGSPRPYPGMTVTVSSRQGSHRIGRTTTDDRGLAKVRVDPDQARRITLVVHSDPDKPWAGKTQRAILAWRWGRGVEGWLDTGRPALAAADPGLKGLARVRHQVEDLLRSYSPDDGYFHGHHGGTGLGTELRRHDVLGGARRRLRRLPPVPEGAAEDSRVALQRALIEAETQATRPKAAIAALHGDDYLTRDLHPEVVAELALGARHQLKDDGPHGSWTLDLARVASGLGHWLAGGEGRAGSEAGRATRQLMDALAEATRRQPEARGRMVNTKAGPRLGPAPRSQRWVAHAAAAHALLGAEAAWPGAGFGAAAQAQLGQLEAALAAGSSAGPAGISTRPDIPGMGGGSPANDQPLSATDLGLGTRLLVDLVKGHGLEALTPAAKARRDEAWQRFVDEGPKMNLDSRLGILAAFVPLR